MENRDNFAEKFKLINVLTKQNNGVFAAVTCLVIHAPPASSLYVSPLIFIIGLRTAKTTLS